MIYFAKISDCILAIKDNLRILQVENISITDLEVYQKFCEIFSIEEFRSSIREYRGVNGSVNLKQELRLILSVYKDYSKFYKEHQTDLNSIDTSYLLRTLIKPIEQQETLAYRKQLPINKSITELTGNYEFRSLQFSDNDPKITSILKELNILKKEKEGLLNVYYEWVEKRKTLERKYSNMLSFKFSNVILKLETISKIIEEDYLENTELLNLNFNNDLLEIINEYFTPTLTVNSAKDFFNNFELSGLKVKKKKMSNTKLYFLIDSLSNSIKDEIQKEKWINTALNYFDQNRDIYDKKKTYEKSKANDDNDFANILLKTLQTI